MTSIAFSFIIISIDYARLSPMKQLDTDSLTKKINIVLLQAKTKDWACPINGDFFTLWFLTIECMPLCLENERVLKRMLSHIKACKNLQ